MAVAVEVSNKSLECFQALKAVHAAYDLAADQLSQQLGVPLCVEDCGLCCMVNVPFAYGIEAAFAVANLLFSDNLPEILARAKDWLEESHGLSIHHEIIGGETLEVSQALNNEINSLARTCCPFLDDDKRCLIHHYRPLTCRAFGVTRIAHNDCKRPLGKNEVTKTAYFGGLGATAIKDVLDWLLAEDPNPIGSQSGFFPSLIYAIARPNKYRKLAMSGNVATAKLILSKGAQGLLWQDQLERERMRALSTLLY